MLSKIKNHVVGYVSSHKRGIIIALFALLVGSMLLRGVMQYPRLGEQLGLNPRNAKIFVDVSGEQQ